MKNTCNQLEELEKEAMNSLNRTKYMNLKLTGENPYNYNNSVKKKKKMNKQINKSMENINVNGITEKNNGEEEKNPNKSVFVNKSRYMSPTNKNQKNNLNVKNKSKTKYGNCISINTYPKNNKSKSSQKFNNNKRKIC